MTVDNYNNDYKGCKTNLVPKTTDDVGNYILKRCTSYKADSAFLFLCAIVTIAIVVWSRMTNRTTRLGH